MRNLNLNELSTIGGGTDIHADKNMVNYNGDNSLYGSVVVPPSSKGQIVLLTVQVLENTFINNLLN